MINIEKFKECLKTYVNSIISDLIGNNPLSNFFAPMIYRVVNNTLEKYSNIIQLIADKNGNVDAENMLNEMKQNLINALPFAINIDPIGDIQIGNGKIQFEIPYINKNLVFTQSDINNFKELLTK